MSPITTTTTPGEKVRKNPHCLICANRIRVSIRNLYQIFNHTIKTRSGRSIVTIISSVLGIELSENNVHSSLICKKCFNTFDKVDKLQIRLSEIKAELTANYKRSVSKYEHGEEIAMNINTEMECDKNVDSFDVQTEEAVNVDTIEFNLDDEALSQSIDTLDVTQDEVLTDEQVLQDYTSFTIWQSRETDLEKEIETDNNNNNNNNNNNSMSQDTQVIEQISKNETVKEECFIPIISLYGNIYACLACKTDERFAGDPKAITLHVKNEHDMHVYICDVCGNVFRKRTVMNAHLDEHFATADGDFQCEVCNRIFSNLRLFRIHKRMHYDQSKLWRCEICDKRYTSRNQLQDHTNTHTGARPHVCKICDKRFTNKYTCQAHERMHETRERAFHCRYCSKAFYSKSNLNQHERRHSNVEEHMCRFCGKAFSSARNLKVHSIAHTDAGCKPYVTNTRKAEIRDPKWLHVGGRPFKCELCTVTFTKSSTLINHKRAVHYRDNA